MNAYQDNKEYFQKVIHVSRQKLMTKYGEAAFMPQWREYTTLVFFDKNTKMARFEVATTHPKMDRFSRKEGINEVLKKLANPTPFMQVDLKGVVTYTDSRTGTVTHMSDAMERKVVAHLLSDFTHEIVPLRFFGKK